MEISINQLEAAINFWRYVPNRGHSRSEELTPEALALSKPYALMICAHQRSIQLEQLEPEARAAIQKYLMQSPE